MDRACQLESETEALVPEFSLRTPSAAKVRGSRRPARSPSELLVGLREGAPWAKAEMFETYAPEVLRVLRRVLGRELHADVKDVVHDVFVQAFATAHRVRDAEALRPWLRSVATHTACRTIRVRKRQLWLRFFAPESLPEQPTLGSKPELVQACRRIDAALGQLTPAERSVFELRYIDGLELPAVARALGCSLSTVKRRVSRAEETFVALARQDPALRQWLTRGSRWPGQDPPVDDRGRTTPRRPHSSSRPGPPGSNSTSTRIGTTL